MNWANHCSKLRVEEFGGGAIAVSAKRIEYASSYAWSEKAAKELKEEIDGKETN